MTNELEEHLQGLLKEFDAKIKKTENYLKDLKEDRQTIQEMLLKQQGFAITSNLKDSSENNEHGNGSTEKLKPVDAILFVMKKNSEKVLWFPPELKSELEILRNQGKLLSDAQNLLYVIHSSLKSLVKRGDVEQDKSGANPAYKLTEYKDGDLPL